MKDFRYILLLAGLFICSFASAQNVTNVDFRQDGSRVVITYDLDETANITLHISTDDGRTFSAPLQEVTGDVGTDIPAGSHTIVWNAYEERGEFKGNTIMFQVAATLAPENRYFSKVVAQGYVYAGADFMKGSVGYSVDASVGVRIRKHVYVGLESGWHNLFNSLHYTYLGNDFSTDYWYVPVGANVKVYVPMYYYKHALFFTATAGGYGGSGYYYTDDEPVAIRLGDSRLVGDLDDHWDRISFGAYCSAGVGMDFGWFSWSAGYTGLFGEVTGHTGYVKVGVRLGQYR